MPVATSQLPFDSDALRANLASTAQEVVIPERYLPLVEAVEGLHGVRAALLETLYEYFHTYRSADILVEGFQTALLRNWPYFERVDERSELFRLFGGLVLDLLDGPLTDAQYSLLLRCLLLWCTDALNGAYGEAYDEGLSDVGARLTTQLDVHSPAFLERDALLRTLVERAVRRPALAPVYHAIYRPVLLAGYERLTEHLDVPGWAAAQGAGLTDPAAVRQRFAFLGRKPMEALARKAAKASGEGLLGADHPILSDILGRAIQSLSHLENLEDRFAVCLFLLKDETLGYRQDEVMVYLLRVVKQMMQPDRHLDVETVLSRLTSFFKGRDNEFLITRFKCYEAIGVAIGEAGDVKGADHLIEDILYWKFQYPDIRGATDEWETVVNPYHLPKIRCWMAIIESNPALFERLAAALNVQLRLGGVYMADTALFQRDVTRFLNADIRPIYFVAKQLLRAFPVYFSDVGAEGELRAVSTQIDEICGRRDTLMHFLRKQAHAESSNRLVAFSRAVLVYWTTLDPSGLEPYLSANNFALVGDESDWAAGPNRVLRELHAGWLPAGRVRRRSGGGPEDAVPERLDEFLDWLLALAPADLETELASLQQAPPPPGDGASGDGASALGMDERRLVLMVRTWQLLLHKYSLSADQVGDAVERHLQLVGRVRERFCRALAAWQTRPSAASRDRLLDAALTVLEELKTIILTRAPSSATENIYQKRHIAAGIPSIYGNYSEPKFDALGLSFRVENLVGILLDDLVEEGIEPYVTRESLRGMASAIKRFDRALAVDGVDSRALTANLSMLEASFSSHNFTFGQYQNVFQFLVNSVTELSTSAILSHDQVLHAVLTHDPRQCEARGLSVDAVAEMVLREVLVSALGMQELDRYVGAALRQVSMLNGRLGGQALTRMMNYDPGRLITPIHRPSPGVDDQMTLGFKGLGLKQMASYGHRVPEGFVLSTELFAAMPAMSYKPLYDDTIQRIRRALASLERRTRLRLGDTEDTLLLSIRSGAAISMPGLMSTFVNVGLNDALAETLAAKSGLGWAAWDSYRRFLQSWAMSDGIDRDFFDAIMTEFKGTVRRGAEARLHARADARDRVRVQGAGARRRRRLRRRPVRAGHELHPQGARLVGLGPRPSLPPVHRRLRRVGHRGRRAAHGLRQSRAGLRVGSDLHEQPAGAVDTSGPSFRRLLGVQSGRGPGRRSGLSAAHLRGAAPGQRHLSPYAALARARLPGRLPEAALDRPRTGRRARVRCPGDRVHLRVAGAGRSLRAAEAAGRAGEGRGDELLRHLGPRVRRARRGGGGRGRRRVLGARGGQRRADLQAAERRPDREHRAAAARHRAGGHRDDRARRRDPDGARRRDLTCRRDREAAGQDRGGGLSRPRGDRAGGLCPSRHGGTACRRLAVDRRAHGEHLPGQDPDARTTGARRPALAGPPGGRPRRRRSRGVA